MATFSLPTGHKYIEARVNWSHTQNISANTSTVTAYVEARRTSSYMSTMDGYSPKLTFWIDGQERIQYASYNFGNHAVNTWFSIGSSVSATVKHSNDGTKSLNIATLYDTTVSNLGNLSKVQSVALNTIPRASVANGGWNWTAGMDTVISIERKSADYHHTVFFDVGFNNTYIGVAARSNVGNSVNSNFNQAEQALIAQKIVDYGNPADIQSRIRVITYNSSNVQIGTEFQYGGLVHRPPESTISSKSSLELTTTGVPYTLSGVYSSKWITHSLKLFSNSFNKTITLANGASTTGKIALTQTEIDALYALYTTQTYAPFNIEVTTLLAGIQLGAKRTITNGDGMLTFNPTAIAPNFTVTPTYSDTNATITAITGSNQHIVQNKSNLRISIPATAGVPKYGATATTYAVSVNGVEKTENYSTSEVIIDFGLVNVGVDTTAQVSVIDSRGARTTKTVNITVIAYSNPTIIGFGIRANGFDSETALYASGEFSSVNSKNSITNIKYRYKATNGTWCSYIDLTATYSGLKYITNAPTIILDNTATFDLEFVVTDIMGVSASSSVFVDEGKPIMFIDKTKKSVGIGKFPENSGSFETDGNSYVGGDAYVSGNIYRNGVIQKFDSGNLASGVDLNNIQNNGAYRLQKTHTNAPENYSYSQMLTVQGSGDTIAQMVFPHAGKNIGYRSGNVVNNGSGAWQPWRYLYDTVNKPTPAEIGAEATITDSGWISSTSLLNGFAGNLHIRKVGKVVEVRGSWMKSNSGDRLMTGVSIFTLPSGYRPTADVWLNATPAPSSTSYPEQHGAVMSMSSDGSVVAQRAYALSVIFNFYVTFVTN